MSRPIEEQWSEQPIRQNLETSTRLPSAGSLPLLRPSFRVLVPEGGEGLYGRAD